MTAFPGSPYAAELRSGARLRRFRPKLEAEYARERLRGSRTLIRAACVLALVLAALRTAQVTLQDLWGALPLLALPIGVLSSAVLTGIAMSRAFERHYLPAARVLVPMRNALAGIAIAAAASRGQLETLMFLPLMVLGPFFFMGLSLRVAAAAVAGMLGAFAVAGAAFGLPPALAAWAGLFLLLAAAACAIGALELENAARKTFLQSRMIAELAEHDALTGLKNRRVFDDALERLWQQAADSGRTIAILLLDVDHFKAYNDRYGHQAGDRTLRHVADGLRASAGAPLDVLARYGGEEFAVVLYDAGGRQAELLAENMRRTVEAAAIEHRESQHGGVVTISVGVAVVEPSRERRARGALQLADQALYQAKQLGRNRVVVLDQAEHGLLITGVFARQSFAAD